MDEIITIQLHENQKARIAQAEQQIKAIQGQIHLMLNCVIEATPGADVAAQWELSEGCLTKKAKELTQ